MNIAKPRLPSALVSMSFEDLSRDEELENASIEGQDGTNLVISGLDLESVLLDKVILTAAHFERINAHDVVVRKSELSSASVSSGAVYRAEFDNCRMTGIDFSRTSLHDVVFRGCKLDMANFRFTNIRRAHFIDCTLIDTDFLKASLYDVAFESCTLEKTNFEQVTCKKVDLRTSDLQDIKGWGSLKGTIIDSVQLASVAPYLAHELGLNVV